MSEFFLDNKINNYVERSKAKIEITSMVTGETTTFPAIFTDMTQNFSSNWTTEEVYGRNDPIATFQGTKRSVSISLSVVSESPDKAADNINRCSKLASFLYPGFIKENQILPKSDGSIDPSNFFTRSLVISRPPLVKIKYGNMLTNFSDESGLLGYIDSFSFAPNVEAGMYQQSRLVEQGTLISQSKEIKKQNADPTMPDTDVGGTVQVAGNDVLFIPRVIDISFTFNALHQTTVGWVADDQGNVTFTASGQKLPFS